MTKALNNHINCSEMQLEMLNAIQERKRCNRLVIIRWRNIILIGDHFGVDLAIISGSGSFRGLYPTANFHVRSALMNKMVKCTNNETILPPNCKHIWLGSCVWFEDFKQRCQCCLIIAFIYTPLLLYHLKPNSNILIETLFSTRVFFSCFGTAYAPQMFFNLSWKRYLQNIYKGKQLITK